MCLLNYEVQEMEQTQTHLHTYDKTVSRVFY